MTNLKEDLNNMMADVKAMTAEGLPSRIDDISFLAGRLERIGDLKLKLKDNEEEAVQSMTAALELLEKYIEDDERISRLADKIANIYYKKGQPEQLEKAVHFYRMGLFYKEKLYAQQQTINRAGELAVMYERVANIDYVFGDEPHLLRAIESYESSTNYQKVIYNLKPSQTHRSQIASGYYRIANIYYRLDQQQYYSKSLKYYGEALDYYLGITDDEKTQHRNLANVYNAMGHTYLKFDRDDYTSLAIDAYTNALVHRFALKEHNYAFLRSNLTTYNHLGEAFKRIRDYSHAIASYDESLKISDRFYQQEQSIDHRRYLSQSYYDRGECRLLNNDRGGVDDLLQCYGYRKDLVAIEPSDSHLGLLSLIANKLGNTYYETGDEDSLFKAITMYEESIAINKRLVVKGEVSMNDLATTYTNLARAYRATNRQTSLVKAYQSYQTGLIFMADYLSEHRSKDNVLMMAGSYTDCAHLCLRMDHQDAVELYEKAFKLMREIYDPSLRDGLQQAADNLLKAYDHFAVEDLRCRLEVHNHLCELLYSYQKNLEKELDGVADIQLSSFVAEKKRQNAIKSYAPNVSDQDIVALYDMTRLHSYKSGFLVTAQRLYASFLPLHTYLYLGGIDEVTGDKKTLTIHYHDQSTLTLSDNFKESLFDVINHMIKS